MRWRRIKTWRSVAVLAAFSAVALIGGSGEIARAAPSPDAYLRQGIALYEQGRYAQAVEAFRKAVQTDPRSSRAYAWLGLAYVKLNRPRLALEAFRKVVEIAPHSEDARVARQWIKKLEARLAADRKPLDIGSRAPLFSLKDLVGVLHRLDEFRNRRAVLLFVWSLDAKNRALVKDLDARVGRADVRYAGLAIVMDADRPSVRSFLKTENVNLPVLFGTDLVAERYGVSLGVPVLYVVSERGIIAQRQVGTIRLSSVLP